MPTDVRAVADARKLEEYVLDVRRTRSRTYEQWKTRTDTLDALYAGDFSSVYPDETEKAEAAKIMNLVQVGIDDLARLAAETQPQTRCPRKGESEAEEHEARIRAGVLDTHWVANEGEDNFDTELGYDLAGPGGAFVAVTYDREESDYPVYTRLDPRGCYPNVVRGKLVDLLVVTRVKVRDVERLYGFTMDERFGKQEMAASTDEAEILEFYDSQAVTTAISTVRKSSRTLAENRGAGGNAQDLGKAVLLPQKTWTHGLGRVPVGWAKMSALDSEYRGAFDQVKGIMLAQNRIVQLMLDYAEQLVYSPFESFDVENDDEVPGPMTVYRLRSREGFLRRVQPAGSHPQLFAILEFLERQGRSGAAYPAQRQGEVSQSIASAAFVSSTLGQLTTQIKAIQKQKAAVRRRCNWIAFKIDESFLDFPKPLLIPVGDVAMYTPSTAIKSTYDNRVVYGAGAGLDAINKKFAVQADVQAQLVSRRTAMEQTDYISNVEGEEAQMRQERALDIAEQKLLASAPASVVLQYIGLLDSGKRAGEALGILAPHMEQVEAQAAQPQGPGPPGAAPSEGPVAAPGVPGAERPQTPLPPLDQAVVRSPAGR